MDAKEKGIMLLSSTASVDLNGSAADETELFTVPTDKVAVPVMVVMRTFSADCVAAVVTFGEAGGDCDEFLGNQTLTGITAAFADEAVVLMAIPAATPVAGMVMDAAEIFGIEITTPAGVTCTCTVDVFGFLYDA